MNDPFMYILLYIVAFIIAILVTRWIFSIGAIVRNLEAQTRLLLLMAEKQGVDINLVNKVSLKAEVFTPNRQPDNSTVAA